MIHAIPPPPLSSRGSIFIIGLSSSCRGGDRTQFLGHGMHCASCGTGTAKSPMESPVQVGLAGGPVREMGVQNKR